MTPRTGVARPPGPSPPSHPGRGTLGPGCRWLLAEGRSNRAMADTLVLSESVVKIHVFRIPARLELDSHPGVVTCAGRS